VGQAVCATTWARIRRWIAHAQIEELTRGLFADLVCESGGVYCEMGYPLLDRAKAAIVDFAAVTSPVPYDRGGVRPARGVTDCATDRGPQSARPGTRGAGSATARAAATRYGLRRSPPLGTDPLRSPTGPDAADAGSGVGSAVLTMQKLQSRYHVVQQSISSAPVTGECVPVPSGGPLC
jgi:hypothetical protein